MKRKTNDPIEVLMIDALDREGFSYEMEELGLDFKLNDYDIFIEVKQFHTDRISDQMSRADNVIAVQGREAAKFLAGLLCDYKRHLTPSASSSKGEA